MQPSNNQTWQVLPPWLLGPLMDQVVTQEEASQLMDLCLVTPEDQSVYPLPPHLLPAVSRIKLWQMEAPKSLPM
jgi:hypothetical protein